MNTIAWFITYTVDGAQQCTAHMHNAIADYRAFDPDATVTAIDMAAVARVMDAAVAVLRDAAQPDLLCRARSARRPARRARERVPRDPASHRRRAKQRGIRLHGSRPVTLDLQASLDRHFDEQIAGTTQPDLTPVNNVPARNVAASPIRAWEPHGNQEL